MTRGGEASGSGQAGEEHPEDLKCCLVPSFFLIRGLSGFLLAEVIQLQSPHLNFHLHHLHELAVLLSSSLRTGVIQVHQCVRELCSVSVPLS